MACSEEVFCTEGDHMEFSESFLPQHFRFCFPLSLIVSLVPGDFPPGRCFPVLCISLSVLTDPIQNSVHSPTEICLYAGYWLCAFSCLELQKSQNNWIGLANVILLLSIGRAVAANILGDSKQTY